MIVSFAFNTVPPSSSLPLTLNEPIAVLVFIKSFCVFISSSGFTSESFFITGGVNLIELLTFSTTCSCSITLGLTFCSTFASFLGWLRADNSLTSVIAIFSALASASFFNASPANINTARMITAMIERTFLFEVPLRS